MCQLPGNVGNLKYSTQICTKMDLTLKFQLTNVGRKISILEIWVWNFRKLMSEKESTSSRNSVCQFPGKMYKFDFFGSNLPKNGIRVGNPEKCGWNKIQHPRDNLCANFQTKRTTLIFSAHICPQMNFGLESSKI